MADPPQKARWQELVSYWAEIIHKLALPIGTVLATIVGTWLTMFALNREEWSALMLSQIATTSHFSRTFAA